jgi:hypothetical protein
MDEKELRAQFEKSYLLGIPEPFFWDEEEGTYIDAHTKYAWDGFVRCAMLNSIADDSVILSYNGGEL